jgi:hypothetical protein
VPQEIKKQTIVIASILKPVDDTRAFEKMAASLAGLGHQVFLIGQPGKTPDSGHPLFTTRSIQKIEFFTCNGINMGGSKNTSSKA